jgi:hypothetical protein
MSDEVLKTLSNYLEPIGPSRQELLHIAPETSWATISFSVDDFSTLPVLWGHIKKLPSDFDIKTITIACSKWNDRVQNLDELRVIINGTTYAWAQDDEYFESGKIHIVGETAIVKAVGSQICEDPSVYEMPAVSEIFPPKAERITWVASAQPQEIVPLREKLMNMSRVDIHCTVPIEDWHHREQRLFAVLDKTCFLRADRSGYMLVGPTQTVNTVQALMGRSK